MDRPPQLSAQALALLREHQADGLAALDGSTAPAESLAADALRADPAAFVAAAMELELHLARSRASGGDQPLGARLTLTSERDLVFALARAALKADDRESLAELTARWAADLRPFVEAEPSLAIVWTAVQRCAELETNAGARRIVSALRAELLGASRPEALARILARFEALVDAPPPVAVAATTEAEPAETRSPPADGCASNVPNLARYVDLTGDAATASALAQLVEHGTLSADDLRRHAPAARSRHRFAAGLDGWMNVLGVRYRVIVSELGTTYACDM